VEAIRAHASAPGAIEGRVRGTRLRFPDVPHASVPIGASGTVTPGRPPTREAPAAGMAVCWPRRRATG
jgi:hypothetical protein